MTARLRLIVALVVLTTARASAWPTGGVGYPTSSSSGGGSSVTVPVPSFTVLPSVNMQSTPTTLAAVQALFPGTTSTKTYTFQETSGNVIEQTGSGLDLVFHGACHYGLGTPFPDLSTSIGCMTATDYFEPTAGTTMDPAGTSFSILAFVRLEFDAYTGPSFLAMKYNGTGYEAWHQSGTFHWIVRDGTTGVQLDATQTHYAEGAWHPVAFVYDAGASQLRIYTDEETVSVSSGAIVPANVTVPAQVATVMGSNSHANAFLGELRYFAFLGGHAVTQAEFNAWATFANGTGLGLTYSTLPTRGRTSLDDRNRDGRGERVWKWGKNQYAIDWRYGSAGILDSDAGSNNIGGSERLWDSTYWTQNGTVTLTSYATESPDGGFSGTKICKNTSGTSGVGIQKAAASAVANAINGSIWLRGDSSGTAYLKISSTGDIVNAGTQVACNYTTAWSRCFVSGGSGTYVTGTTATLYLYPVDPSSTTATGCVYGWGAMVATNSATISPEYWPTFPANVDNGNLGVYTSSAGWGTGGPVWVEAVVTPLPTPPPFNIGWFDSPSVSASNLGGLRVGFGSPSQLEISTYKPDGTSAYAASNVWNTTKWWITGRDTHILVALDPTQGTIRACVDGICELPLTGLALPINLNPAGIMGWRPDNPYGHLPMLLKRLRTGAGTVTAQQARLMAGTSTEKVSRRIVALGDSITNFPDGYHRKLVLDIGGHSQAANQGVSGQYTQDVLNRMTYATASGLGYTDAVVLVGVNDLYFGSLSASTVETNLQSIYDQLAAAGIRVCACTITPAKNNTFNNWTSAKQVQHTAVNQWILAKPRNVAVVADLYTAVVDPANAYTYLPANTTDYLHPSTPVGRDLEADTIYQQCFGSAP